MFLPSSNNLMVNPSLSQAPLVERFQKEWDRTVSAIKWDKKFQIILIASAVALVAVGLYATVVKIAGIYLLCAALLAYKMINNLDRRKQILANEERLKGRIFNEVLWQYDSTPSKIEVFRQFGSRCQELDVSDMPVGIEMGLFLDMAIKQVLSAKAEVTNSSSDLNEIGRRTLVYNVVMAWFGELKKQYGSVVNSVGRFGIEGQMHTVSSLIDDFCRKVRSLSVEELLKDNAELASIKTAISAELAKPNSCFLSVNDLGKMVAHCTNLKVLKINGHNQEFKEIVGNCDGPECAKHQKFTVVKEKRYSDSPCQFKTIAQFFALNFAFMYRPKFKDVQS